MSPRNEQQDKKFMFIMLGIAALLFLAGWYKSAQSNYLVTNGIITEGTCVSFIVKEECVTIDEYTENCSDVEYPVVIFIVEGKSYQKAMSCNIKEKGTLTHTPFAKDDLVPVIYLADNPHQSAQINNDYCLARYTNYFYYFALGTLVLTAFIYWMNR